MKTHILKLYITICYFLVATVSYAINCEGNGTADSPYIIKSADNLKELSTDVRNGNSYNGTYFVLGDNIDMNGVTIKPIGDSNFHFSGNFDGKGFVIKNLSINGTYYLGLFGWTSGATITNIGIENEELSGEKYIGGIVGYCSNTVITNCYTRGHIYGNGYEGALVGYSSNGTTIQNCFSSSQHTKVTTTDFVGGLVGYNAAKIENCYFYGTINAQTYDSKTIGGIVGYNHTTGYIYHCFYLKYGDDINGKFDYCGSLNWGSASGMSTFDVYGITEFGLYLHEVLNTWVTNHVTKGQFRKWTQESFPSLVKYAGPIVQQNMINGHEYVDLGLPSGRLWAKTNYGANTESEYGLYMVWSVRNSIQSGWGEEWNVPTSDDFTELCNQCTFSWGNNNSVYGCFVTGPNGNSIFLPAAGFKINGLSQMAGQNIYYWSDAEYESGFAGALSGSLNNGINSNSTYNYSVIAMTIRPVTGIKENISAEEYEDAPEYVDLALPSGNLWAKTNIGAKKENEYGNKYAFGETSTKEKYMEDNYKWLDQKSSKYTKYTLNGTNADNKVKLAPEDDAATKLYGANWKTPSQKDFIELTNYCISKWEVLDGIPGMKFTGTNGNSIFLPAGGFIYWYNEYKDQLGYYMTSDLFSNERCWLFYFSDSKLSTAWMNVKYEGYSVRPITNKSYTGILPTIMNSNRSEYFYNLNGSRQNRPTKGLNIIRGNDGTTIKVIMK